MPNFIATDDQWEKMKRFIKGDKYKKEDFFVFETLAVGDRIVPNRYMRITPALLQIMAEDARKGVSLMLNHNWSQLGVQSIPIGKVFDARIEDGTQDGETQALYTTQYILRDDSKVDGYSKNDIIKLIESGILTDTSVGWGTDRDSYKCSICHNSIYDYRKCEHIPGRKYIINEETNEVQQCIIEAEPPKELTIGNNVLMENSIVFDGAYPNAIIQSSIGDEVTVANNKFQIIEGKAELNDNSFIIGYTTNGSINLLCKKEMQKGGDTMEGNEETTVPETTEVETQSNEVEENIAENVETDTETNTQSNETNNAETDLGVQEEQGTETLYTETDILEKFENIATSIESLIKLAKEGNENRKVVIENALESGIHSMGNAFNKEVFEKTFSNMETKDIQEMGKTWEDEANKKFKKDKVSKQDFSSENQNDNVSYHNFNSFKTDSY